MRIFRGGGWWLGEQVRAEDGRDEANLYRVVRNNKNCYTKV